MQIIRMSCMNEQSAVIIYEVHAQVMSFQVIQTSEALNCLVPALKFGKLDS